MPNKYQREIEEILRNMGEIEPRQGLGSRMRAFNRKSPRGTPRTPVNQVELFFLAGVILALAAAGLTFYASGQVYLFRLVPVNGALAVLAFAAFIAGTIVGWRQQFGVGGNRPKMWRGNVVEMKPRRRNPFSALATRYRMLRLKLRYRNFRHDAP